MLAVDDVERGDDGFVQHRRGPKPRHSPTCVQHFGSFNDSARRVDPVPCLAAGDKVESAPAGVPRLEGGDFHLDTVTARHLGHPFVRLDAENGQAAFGEGHSGFAGTAPDIEHRFRSQAGQIVDQSVGVCRTIAVVLFGHRAK